MQKTRGLVTAVCLVAVLGAGAGAWALLDGGAGSPAPASAAADARDTASRTGGTAPVVQGDLTDSKVFAGVLGYGAATGVPGAANGTLTWLPKAGQVVHRDEPLYAVNERAVRSMHGTVPLWRSLQRGTEGTDVRQLTANLAALGYDVAEDDTFGPRTQRAVERWQRDRGQTVTGVLTSDDIAFVDGDVRVGTVTGKLGQPADGDVLEVTSTARVVTATVPERDAARLAVGTAVDVRVNGTGKALPGKVSDVRPTATQDGAGGTGRSGGSGGSGTTDVEVSFDAGGTELPAAATAQLVAKGRTERDVTSVPVSALVAGTGERGGYAVDVVRRDGTTKRVPVEVGFVADGRAAVTGGVSAGDDVVVPR